ncbi:MAG: DoxX family protein [Planctomycetaceae bacterium]
MNIGMLLSRLILGSLFVGHGTQKLFGWWHGGGVGGTGDAFERAGFGPGRRFAVLAGMTETAGGLMVAAGFLTPLGAAAVIGVMTAAIGAVHLRNGLWNTNGGIEFPLLAATVAATVAFTGPGGISLDSALGWHLAGPSWGVLAIALGLVSGMAMLGWRRIQLRRRDAHARDAAPRPRPEAA